MAEGDFNLATLWLPVAPSTEKVGPAMEQAGKEAKSKFGSAVKGIGDSIHDDLARAGNKASEAFHGVGQRITDIFAKAGSDSGKSLSDSFGRAVSQIPGSETVAEPIRKLSQTASEASTNVRALGDAFSRLKGGDLDGALGNANKSLQGIENSAKRVGIDVSEWSSPLGDALAKSDEIKGSVGEFAGIFKDLPGRIGAVGSAIAELAGPIGIAVAAGKQLADELDHVSFIHDRFFNPDGSYRNPIDRWASHIPGLRWLDPDHTNPNSGLPDLPLPSGGPAAIPPGSGAGQPSDLGGLLGGNTGSPIAPAQPHTPYPTTRPPGMEPHNFYKDWYPPTAPDDMPGPTTPGRSSSGSRSGSGYTRPSFSPSVGSRADLHAAGSRIAYLYQVAESLNGTPYSKALRNDCSGMVSQLAAAALGLPPPSPGERFTTVNEGQWLFSHGFKPGIGPAGSLQIGWYDHGGGDAGHTAATLPGGEHAESGGSHGNFLLGPGAAGAENSEFEHHAYLPMGGMRSGPGTDSSPLGTEHDPIYVSQADTGTGSSGSSPFEAQGQQLGQGLVNGLLQMVGLDGSVFGGKSPLDFGSVKMATGLLNWGMGVAQTRSAISGGGGPSMGGLGGLIPSPGAMISAAAMPAGGSRGIGANLTAGGGDVNIHNDYSTNVSGNTIKDNADLVQRTNWQQNSRGAAVMSSLPAPSVGSP